MKILIDESQYNRIVSTLNEQNQVTTQPTCNENGCYGTYVGAEFTNNGDVAHQYSNTITKEVGKKLKELFKSGTYVKVDMDGIRMSTKGMGSGNVVYKVIIPFIGVSNECDAMTGFAHVGGWGHTPALSARKSEILSYIPSGKTQNQVVDNQLDVSDLTKTKEGLEEYWIQWRHRDYQSKCGAGQSKVAPKKSTQSTSNSQKKLVIRTADLSSFMEAIKSGTEGKTFDLKKSTADVDRFVANFVEDPNGTKVIKMVLAVSLPNKPCESCKSILTKNNAQVVDEGTFEGGKREYNLIAIIS